MGGEDVIDELLDQWEEARSSGQEVSPEVLCRDHPEYLPELQRQIRLLEAVAPFVGTGESTEGQYLWGAEEGEVAPEFPDYTEFEILGRGGMGVVYEARQTALGRTEAVKVIRKDVLANPIALRRFEQEIRTLGKLKHPNIIPIYSAKLTDTRAPYFSMEYLPGGSLKDSINRFQGNPLGAVELMEKVARGVDFAHENGILHRDLKPGNILLGAGDEPLVSDFGIAKLLSEPVEEAWNGETPSPEHEQTAITRPGVAPGTLAYMSPEHAAGAQIDRRADVWSLGVVLYELVVGQHPFSNDETLTNNKAMYDHVFEGQFHRPRAIDRSIDLTLEGIILRCLRRDPTERYATAKALADDLKRWQSGDPVKNLPESNRRRVRRWARRYGWAVGILLIASLAGVGVYQLTKADTDQHQDPRADYLRRVTPLVDRVSEGEVFFVGPGVTDPAYHLEIEQTKVGRVRYTSNENPAETGVSLEVFAADFGAVELLPQVPLDRYQIAARVRHDDISRRVSYLGVFLCYSLESTATDRCHWFMGVEYADMGEGIKLGTEATGTFQQVKFALNRLQEREVRIGRLQAWDFDSLRVTTDPRTHTPALREIVIKVDGSTVTAEWDGGQVVKADIEKQLAMMMPSIQEHVPHFDREQIPLSLNGPVGVFVAGASATIESFSVAPLPRTK